MEITTREYRLEEFAGPIGSVLESGGEFRFMPRGTSMLPYLREGRDVVAIVRIEGAIKKHDIVLYRRKNGKYVLHRVVGLEALGYVMCGDNQIMPERGISGEQIIGKVAVVYRGGKPIEPARFPSRLYSRLWGFMPLRRCVFFARRVVSKIKRMLKK